ncbi:hypothetical protein [Mariniphaga sp.]|uniref:hypothetical protein n=1 Tax=Mariniphaga sp. TaxID=1954475 RepID=UPI0035694577
MKIMTMFILLSFAFVFAFAQDDEKSNEIRTLSGNKSLGFYGAATIGYSQMEAKDALVIGGRAGLIFNHSTALGLAGYGFFNNLDGYNLPVGGEGWYSLAGGYGGIFIEPILGATKPVHVSFPVLVGMGGVGLVRNVGPGTWEDPWDIEIPENDFFFVLEPAVDLEFNLTSFFRMAATLSYRFTSNVELIGKTPDVLQGWNFGLTFKFGKF